MSESASIPNSRDLSFDTGELLRFERTLSEVSARLIAAPSDQVDQEIEGALESIAALLCVERCTLTEYLTEEGESYTRFSYARDGHPRIPRMRADQLFPWTTGQLVANRVVVLRYPDGFPPEADVDRRNAELAAFRSGMNIPIVVGGFVRFILSVVSVTEDRIWPEELVPRLKLFGEIFSSALIRKQRDEEIRRLKAATEEENISLREVVRLQFEHDEIVGKSDALLYVLYKVEQVAQTDVTVLLLGETGVGKELFARAIHRSSKRREGALVKVDCAALAPSLIESELFGHERGAFTGAFATHKGRFEIAAGGTVFLDEIGELPLELQSKLLRVLEDGVVRRVGGAQLIKVNIRVVAATNRNLEDDVESGRFRRDLYYRLNAFPLTVPPLRDRTSDIPVLADHFVRHYCAQHSRPPLKMSASTLKMLKAYAWPGNVRELENVIERSVITSPGKSLVVPPLMRHPPRETGKGTLRTLEEVEREHILATLEKALWRIEGPSGAAKILGLHPDTLRYRMKKLHLHRPRISGR
jgi:transcriptional regulator with GAF, ATPase, and Fis domain